MTTIQNEAPEKPAHESFAKHADGSATCNDCGQKFSRGDGSIYRSHRNRVHGEAHYVPARCFA